MLKLENKVLVAENKQLKVNCKGMVSVGDVEREIAELWIELKRLKKNKETEGEISRKKIYVAYAMLVVSWVFFITLFMVCM